MITAEFVTGFTAFEVSGHAGFADAGSDIVCAAVTSCAQFAANTITDVIHAQATVRAANNRMSFALTEENKSAAQLVEGLYHHLSALSEEYPENVRVIYKD